MIAVGDALAFVLTRHAATSRARISPAIIRPAAWAASCSRSKPSCARATMCGSHRRTRDSREVFGQARRRGRRTGAVMFTDADGKLRGIFTDSDLARLFEQRRDDTPGPAHPRSNDGRTRSPWRSARASSMPWRS